ncbi:hypothetical protein ACWEN6_15740 [Sphaerisporangium sp. NPDC004334]
MIDFFKEDSAPWARRLWDVGSLLALEELWEVGTWQARGVLSSVACDWQRAQLRVLIGPDRGLGERELRKEITDLLARPLPDPSPARRRLREIIDHARCGYLERWAAAVVAPDRPGAERFSRTVAAHLLDLGYSSTHLMGWVQDLYSCHADTGDIAASAAALAQAETRSFEVLIALSGVPHRALAEPLAGWVPKEQVIAWLHKWGHSTVDVRPGGGFSYRLNALDVYGAAEQARQMIERMVARSSYLRHNRAGITPLPYIWVAGHPAPIRSSSPARGADVVSLVNE